jgi:RimJ/RimL family protein N-acetyltransferase
MHQSKDGRQITVRYAMVSDARSMYTGFKQVIEEGEWFPTFSPASSTADWVSWIHKTARSRDILLVAHVDTEFAGHLTLQPEEWMASEHVAKVGVLVIKPLRGIGVGRALMLSAEEAGRESGYEKFILSTFVNNEPAISLYRSLDYLTVGTRNRHFKMPNGYIDEVLMEKAIDE